MGRAREAATNQALHAVCHQPGFYQDLLGDQAEITILPIDAPLSQVASRQELITLLRMALLDPLSTAPCDTDRVDAFIAGELDRWYPALTYPVTLPSRDDMIIIRKKPVG